MNFLDGPCAGYLDFVSLVLVMVQSLVAGIVTFNARAAKRAERQRAELMREVKACLTKDFRQWMESEGYMDHPGQTRRN